MCIDKKFLSRSRCSCATTSTANANRTWYSLLNFSDEREKECALRGLIESPDELVIKRDDGEIAWDLRDFDFIKDKEAPDTVNPSDCLTCDMVGNCKLQEYCYRYGMKKGTWMI